MVRRKVVICGENWISRERDRPKFRPRMQLCRPFSARKRTETRKLRRQPDVSVMQTADNRKGKKLIPFRVICRTDENRSGAVVFVL